MMAVELREKTSGEAPVEIGSRGTVGSLIMQEIRYFKSHEVTAQDIPKSECVCNVASTSNHSEPAVSLALAPKKKKRMSRRFLPSICTLIDVSDNRRPVGISQGLGYRPLESNLPARSPA